MHRRNPDARDEDEAALAGDQDLSVPLKEVRRVIKFYRGPFTEQAYERLKGPLPRTFTARQIPRSR